MALRSLLERVPRPPRPRVLCLLFLGLASCWSVDKANLAAIQEETGISLSEGEPPRGAVPLQSLAIGQDGFYLLGFIPIVPIDLDRTFRALVKEAKAVGAKGVAKIRYVVDGPSPTKFQAFPIPDWSASIRLTGMTWK